MSSDGYINGYERGYESGHTAGLGECSRTWHQPPTGLKGWQSLYATAHRAGETLIVLIKGASIDDLKDGIYHIDSIGGVSDDLIWVGIDPLASGWSTSVRHVISVLRIPKPPQE